LPLAILVNRARRLLQAGFGYGDIGVAFRAEIEQQREERAVEHGRGPSRLERVLRLGALVGLGGAALSMIVIVAGIGYPWGYDEFGLSVLMSVGVLVGLGSGLPVLIMLQRRRDVDAEAYASFWTGSIGRWLFGLAGSFTSTKSSLAAMTHRPTELSIGMAAEQLFATLPKQTRHQLRDLPDVVHRLEEDAQRMRRRLQDLHEALAGPAAEDGGRSIGGDAEIETRRWRIVIDLQAERDRLQQRLSDAVKALESLRLNLLRLHAGSGSVHSLTTDLGLAREVAKELGFLLEAEREIEELH
jgi:serine/threonine-protein kinase